MEDVKPVEVFGFEMRKISQDTWDRPCTDELELVGDLYSFTVVSNVGIQVFLTFLLEDRRLSLRGLHVRRQNQRPQIFLRSLTVRASIVLDAHKVDMLHEICKPQCSNWPATACFVVGTRPPSTSIDVMCPRKSNEQLQKYFRDLTRHLHVYIALGSVIGCGILLEFGRHREEGKQNLGKVTVFVQYRGLDIPNGQVDQPRCIVAGEVLELRLIRSIDQWYNCCPRRKSILRFLPPVCRIHHGIHSITLHLYGPGWSKDQLVIGWVLLSEVPLTFCRVSKIEKPPIIWCGDGSFS